MTAASLRSTQKTAASTIRMEIGSEVPFRNRAVGRFEFWLAAGLLAGWHLILFFLQVPRPHEDLGFYTEPAFQFATTGRIIAPALQHLDVSYADGWYFYPPLYPIVLGLWIKLFGLSHATLLAFTQLCHFACSLMLFALLRCKWSFGLWGVLIGCIPIFITFTHGRPDQLGMALGIGSWLALPSRPFLSGFLLGLSGMASPAFGVASAVPAALLAAMHPARPALNVARLVAVAAGTAALLLCAVLTQQNAWSLSITQFAANSIVRGAEINSLPALLNPYSIRFCLTPLFLFTLFPLAATSVATMLEPTGNSKKSYCLWLVLYVSQFLALFVTVKAHLMYWLHFMLPAHAGWIAAGASSRTRFVSIATMLAGSLYAASSVDLSKHDYLALLSMSGIPQEFDVPAGSEAIAVDSVYFPLLRKQHLVVCYGPSASKYWIRYREASRRLPLYNQKYDGVEPVRPGWVVLSRARALEPDAPATGEFTCLSTREPSADGVYVSTFWDRYRKLTKPLIFRRVDLMQLDELRSSGSGNDKQSH